MNTEFAKRVVETALICSQQPLGMTELRKLFDDELSADVVRNLLGELGAEWTHKGVELCTLSNGWRFQSKPEMRDYIDKLHPEKPPKYSRAVMETLAIIAYKQPVTRGDIEDIRGVAVNSEVLQRLVERDWVESIGNREAPGRPALYATTTQFLNDLGLHSLDQLPSLDPDTALPDLAQGLLSLDGLENAVNHAHSDEAAANESVADDAAQSPLIETPTTSSKAQVFGTSATSETNQTNTTNAQAQSDDLTSTENEPRA